jgi:PAS domain S-box-containing protein
LKKNRGGMKNKAKIFSELEKLAPTIPAPVGWADENGVALGCNDLAANAVGVTMAQKGIIGKTPYEFEFYSKEAADLMMNKMKQAMQEKKPILFEESIVDIESEKVRYFLTTRAPLFDDDGINVVGTIGTSVEITDRKEAERLRLETELQKTEIQEQTKFRSFIDQAAHDTQSPLTILLVLAHHCKGLTKGRIFESLRSHTAFVPISIFWLDADNRIIGANKLAVVSIGGVSIDDYIGKTAYEIYPYEMADNIVRHNNEVMRTGKVLSQEESIRDVTTGKTKYFIAYKAPLYDDKGNVVGLIGTSVDITTEKNAECLKLETELQKTKIQEQENFATVASQVSHDIRSPLASLEMILASCKDIPEAKRIALRSATKGVTAIADNLLNKYRKYENEKDTEAQEPQPILASLALEEILSLKKSQYSNSLVKFNSSFEPKSSFVFIKADPSNFNRMISNLINNAVDAFEGKEGEIDLKLSLDDEQVNIIIQDNGKGMPQEIIDKIMNNVAVTAGKKDGNGIGLAQVRNTLQASRGKMSIDSKIGTGTKIVLTFPRVGSPDWIAEEIVLHKGDTVVVLDDDDSIHDAWDARFEDYADIIQLEHFRDGEEAADFINNAAEKNKIFLLSDFELISQKFNGLQIIENTSMRMQSILVTSHYHNQPVRDLAAEVGVKILPKQLAPEVPIKIEETERNKSAINNFKKIELVIIDDDQLLADSLANLLKKRFVEVEAHYHPNHFLKNLSKYAKDTIICMDHDLKAQIDGIELAKRLNEAGYIKLYLLSGKTFEEGEVPDYLTVLLKGDTDALDKLV